jgi:recombination protein RecA
MAKKQEELLDKEAKIKMLKESLSKDYGKGCLIGASEKYETIPVVKTGSISLDIALGVGGLPIGRVVEIFGPESSGKTTLALSIIREALKVYDKRAAIVDAEHALDIKYMKNIGIDLNRVDINQPGCGEEALNVVEKVVKTGAYAVVVIDSVAALTPKSEVDGEIGDSSLGKQARLMSQALRKLTPLADENGTILIFINQLREKIGVMFGNPETTTGGNALKFYSSVRLDIRKKISNKDGEEFISNTVKVKVIKNKVASPYKEAFFDIEFGKGINNFKEVVDIATELGIFEKSGSWYSYEGNKLGQGLISVIELLESNSEFYEEVKNKIISFYDKNNVVNLPNVEEEKM